ncbi:uncharacterized protein LOC133801706 isoform X2 [Humulus lupulus]|uniref:uncharacterized protein LOC133801706 isoform X2 n=1 Tax=Humulus lupulus TaxID=3486 RepID=UPI002B408399|nr:uncharacterized protein LOC133801706 isoform X2 [Humulus lupulus]
MHEFALISGFNCGKSNDPNLSSLRKGNRLKKEYFRDIEGHITLKDLETMFVDMSEENLVGELKKKKKYIKKNWDHLRLALLYCLEGVVLAHELAQPIGEENMGIVEDFDVFNKYPWGRLCYNLTLDGLKTNLKKKSVKYQNKVGGKKSKESYKLYGFPYIFQVWIYEAILLLGNLFANPKEGNVTPRCLHWEAKEPEYKEISQALKLTHGKIDVHHILHASELEKCQPYMKDFELLNDKADDLIDTFVKKLKVCNPVLSEYNKEEEKVDVSDDKKMCPSASNVNPNQNSGNVIKLWVDLEKKMNTRFDELMKRQDEMDSKLDLVLSMMVRSSGCKSNQPEFELEAKHNGIKVDGGECGDAYSYVTPPTFNGDDVVCNNENEVEVTSPHPRPMRKRKRAPALMTPYTDPTKRRKFRKGEGFKVDPFRKIDEHKEEAFMKWFNENNTSMLINCGTGSYQRKYFEQLFTPATWLSTDHIDEALWGMRKRSQKYHDLFDQNVAILDEFFSQWLCGHWEKFNLGAELLFSFGNSPLEGIRLFFGLPGGINLTGLITT